MEHNLIQVNQSLVNMHCWSTLMAQFIPGVTRHTHTRPFTKILFPIPWSKPFDKRKDVLGVNFSCNRSYVTIFCICVMSLLPQSPPQEYFSRSRFFDRPKHKFVYKQEFRKYRSHILYNNKGPEWKLPDQFKSLISLLPDKWNSLKSVRNFVENHSG